MAEQSITTKHLPLVTRAAANLAREDEARKAMAFFHQQVAAAIVRKSENKSR
jgi:hypothetical protein